MAAVPERNLNFDLLRIFLAFLVVHLHVLSFIKGPPYRWDYYLGWYAVPLFVGVTFFLNSRFLIAGDSHKLKSKLLRFLLPFVFWSAVGFALHPDLLNFKMLLRQLLTGTAVNPPLYYLLSVSWLTLTAFAVSKFTGKNKFKVFGVITVILIILEITGFITWVQNQLPEQLRFFGSRTLEMAKFGFGILAVSRVMQNSEDRHRLKWLTIIALLLLPVSIFQQMASQHTGNYAGLFVTFLVISGIYTLGNSLHLTFRSYCTKLISFVSRYSLGVYCLHFLFVEKFIGVKLPSLVISVLIFVLSWLFACGLDLISTHRLAKVVS